MPSNDGRVLFAVVLIVAAFIAAMGQVSDRPATVPAAAVRVNGNFVECTPHGLYVENACTVYSGSTGKELDSDPLTERLAALSSAHGGPVVDCGRTPLNGPDPQVAECAKAAFQKQQSFRARYDRPESGFLAYGVAGDAEGNVFLVSYDRTRGFPPVAPTKNTRLFDWNHSRVKPCIRPVILDEDEDGILGCVIPVNDAASASAAAATKVPIETSLCAIADDPWAFNNKLVRVRGYVSGNFEYSMLSDDGCSDSLWFAYANGDGPPGLSVMISGEAQPGAEDPDGKRILPIPVKLVRDRNFQLFEKVMYERVKADKQAEKEYEKTGKHVSYQVTSTFVGRIDAVLPEIREFHRKKKSGPLDYLGFGHLGQFDAQFVLQSVEEDSVLGERD